MNGVWSGRSKAITGWFPWTPLGSLVAVSATVSLWAFGLERLDLVLLVVGYAGLGIVVLAGMLCVVAALPFWLRTRAADAPAELLSVETEQPTPSGFSIKDLRWLPLVRMRWTVENPPTIRADQRRRGNRLIEQVTSTDRGETTSIRRRFIVQDALGLARVSFCRQYARRLRSLPHTGGLRTLPVLVAMARGDEWPHPHGVQDGDRVDLRRYVAGDPARFIHWKVYGRTRKLTVRVPEQALSHAHRVAAYLVAGPEDNATAAAARVGLASPTFLGDWVFGADGHADITSDLAEATQWIATSSARRNEGATALSAFIRAAEATGPVALVLFVPPVAGPWLQRVAAVTRRRRAPVRVVVGVDFREQPPTRGLLRRLLFQAPTSYRANETEVRRVVSLLSAANCDPFVLDRLTGQVFAATHRKRVAGRGRPISKPGHMQAI